MDLQEQLINLIDKITTSSDQEEVDSVQLFIDKYLVPCEEQRETLGSVHRAYLAFCSENGYIAEPMCRFPLKLREKGLTVKTGRGNRFFVHKHYLAYK